MLAAALAWARGGVPVFPLHEVFDAMCSCAEGSECKNAGKHPRTRRGLKGASVVAPRIAAWWQRWPHANIGGVTGGAARLLVLDSDPRHGGDASLRDLAEAHGDEWLATRHVKTGGGGDHFFFTYPEGVEMRNTAGKLAPGIDTRAEGGYIVLPPSLHLSGARYELTGDAAPQLAPAWLVEALTRKAGERPARVINFQERRAGYAAGARHFNQGERNDGLRDVACGRWLHGYAEDAQELYRQMLEVRDTRCADAPGDPPPSDSELWDLVQRTARKFPRGVLRTKGGAA